MKNVHGWYLPDNDVHFTEYLDGLHKAGHPVEYQREQREKALSHCDNFRGAIDIGAHVGLWARPLCDKFKEVYAVEPCEDFLSILEANAPYAKVWNYAVGEEEKKISLKTNQDNSGVSFVDPSATDGECLMIRLDNIVFKERIDFIKIDCEGYELPILKGASGIIEEDQPVVIVEQKPHKTNGYGWGQHAAIEYLIETHNYRIIDRVIDDWVLKPAPKGAK